MYSLGQGNIFTGVCDSVNRVGVHGAGGGAMVRGDVHGRGMGAGCAWSCGGVHGGDPPLPIRMATAASGTHPTGMHSCVNFGTATQ